MTFTVNILLTCILYCDAGPAVIRTFCKYIVDSYYRYHICFSSETTWFYFEKAIRSLCFLQLFNRADVFRALYIGLVLL